MDRWEAVLKPEDHQHEVGEAMENCTNCRLDRAATMMSAFEVGVWNWYFEIVNHFTIETGIVADEFRRIGLRGSVRKMALAALNSIHLAFQAIAAERARKMHGEN